MSLRLFSRRGDQTGRHRKVACPQGRLRRLFLLLIGIAVFVWGAQEYWVSRGASEQPQDVDLAKLEAGERPSQNHIRLGKHLRLYPSLIYATPKNLKDIEDPFVNYSFYPIISPSHPKVAMVRIEDIAAAGGYPIPSLRPPAGGRRAGRRGEGKDRPA
jgi:hypothetical protein